MAIMAVVEATGGGCDDDYDCYDGDVHFVLAHLEPEAMERQPIMKVSSSVHQ